MYRCSVELSIGFGTLYFFDHSPRIYPIMSVFRLFVPSRIYPFMKVFVFFVSSRIYPFMNVWESYGCSPILDSCVSYGGFPIINIFVLSYGFIRSSTFGCHTDLSDHQHLFYFCHTDLPDHQHMGVLRIYPIVNTCFILSYGFIRSSTFWVGITLVIGGTDGRSSA